MLAASHQNAGRQSVQLSQTAEIRGIVGFIILQSIFEPTLTHIHTPAGVACRWIKGRMTKDEEFKGALTHVLLTMKSFDTGLVIIRYNYHWYLTMIY